MSAALEMTADVDADVATLLTAAWSRIRSVGGSALGRDRVVAVDGDRVVVVPRLDLHDVIVRSTGRSCHWLASPAPAGTLLVAIVTEGGIAFARLRPMQAAA